MKRHTVKPIATRFFKYVEQSIFGPCWEWKGPKDSHGYGTLNVGCFKKTRHKKAHRIAYQIFIGDFDESLFVCHKCDNPGCVNPAHLFLGTHIDNERDKCEKNRQQKGSKHWNSKLTEKDIINIRKLYANKISQIEISRRFQVSQGCISRIVRMEDWKHV